MNKLLHLSFCAAAVGMIFNASASVHAASAVVYDNLGAANAVMTGGGAIGIVAGTEYEQGLQFTTTQTVKLTGLDLTLSHVVSGASIGSAIVQLRTDNNGVPGTVVESWTTPSINLLTATLTHLDSATGATVAANKNYWITVSKAPNSTFGGAWNFSKESTSTLDAWRTLPNDWSTIFRRAYGTRITGAPVINGDADQDGRIDADDFALIDRALNKRLAGWNNADFNGDAVVDSSDYLILDTAYALQQGGILSPDLLAARESEFGTEYAAALVAAVPEPTSATFLLLGTTGLAGLRRRRLA